MADNGYQDVEAWNTTVRLAAAVGRLKVGSNLKASADAQQRAFEQAGLAAALVAEGAQRDGGGAVPLFRDARGALAQCRSWLHVLAMLMNEPDTVFDNEHNLADQASRQLNAMLRNLDRAPAMGAPMSLARPARPMGPGGPGSGVGPRGDRPPRPAGGPR
ncbi:MAG: hypothetical protein ACKVVT_19745 [Dehalococcoidia bacterium]